MNLILFKSHFHEKSFVLKILVLFITFLVSPSLNTSSQDSQWGSLIFFIYDGRHLNRCPLHSGSSLAMMFRRLFSFFPVSHSYSLLLVLSLCLVFFFLPVTFSVCQYVFLSFYLTFSPSFPLLFCFLYLSYFFFWFLSVCLSVYPPKLFPCFS